MKIPALKPIEFTINFKGGNMHIAAGNTKVKYNPEQALQLLEHQNLSICNDTQIMGFDGAEFKQVCNGIREYYNIREWC